MLVELGELGELVAEHGVAELGHVGEIAHGQLVRAVHLEEVVLQVAEQLRLGLLLTWSGEGEAEGAGERAEGGRVRGREAGSG